MIPVAIIAAALSAAGSMYGSAQSASATRKAQKAQLAAIDKQRSRNTNTLNYLMGARNASQKLIDHTADQIRERNASRMGTQKVVGGTQASVQAGQKADADALANVTETAVAQGLDDRRQALANYTQQQNALDLAEGNVNASAQNAISQNTAQATKSLAQTAGQVIASVGDNSSTNTPTTGITASTTPTSTATTATQTKTPFAKKAWESSSFNNPNSSQNIIKRNFNEAVNASVRKPNFTYKQMQMFYKNRV